jgi:threonylcarbamoyladenosine tRNA methylthiotransferase MtaB
VNVFNPPRVALGSLGCKVNQAETEHFSRQLAEAGFQLVDSTGRADMFILNTCSVTATADRKSRHMLRMARRSNPNLFIVATGCSVQRDPAGLSSLGVADILLKHADKPHLLDVMNENGRFKSGLIAQPVEVVRTRSFIKIQDGCSNFCAYCIVPHVRGREVSLPADDIISQVKERAAQGCKEVVLTGVRVGTYDFQSMNLKDLLERVLRETDIARVRLSSLQPQEISSELISLWRDERLCPHFHFSLQSGSNSVLQRMGRRYSTREYGEALALVRSIVPEAAITTDIITGFPGETEADFEQSYKFCRAMEFARVHIFPFSPRPGTTAALMRQTVSESEKRARTEKMLELGEECVKCYRERFTGRRMLVLWEKQSGGVWSGLTGNYLKIYSRSSADLTNKLEPVTLA